jgi:O-antigen/teichoic acid export membrane protein
VNRAEESVLGRAFTAGAGKLSWDVLSRALSFALSILVARRLGATGFGAYSVYWYAAWLAAQATDLGLHLTVLRSLSRSYDARRFWSAAAAKLVLTAVALAAVFALRAVVDTGAVPSRDPVLPWLLAAQLLGSWVEFLGVTLRSRGGIAREGLSLTLLRFGWLAGAGIALSRGTDLTSLAAALALASVPALLLAIRLVANTRLSFWAFDRVLQPAALLKESLPLGLVSAMTLIYLRADLFLVAAIAGAAEAGRFQSAFRLFEASFVVSGGVAAGTFPLLAGRYREEPSARAEGPSRSEKRWGWGPSAQKKAPSARAQGPSRSEERWGWGGSARKGDGFHILARSLLAVLLLLAAPIALSFALIPGPLLSGIYGESFVGASRPLALLGLALVAVFANAHTTHLLVASGRNRRLVASIAVRLVVGVLLDLFLVPRWGAFGAAVAVAAAEWSLLVVSLSFSSDLLGFAVPARRLSTTEVTSCS